MLGLLRSQLADMERVQRASGGTAAPDWWLRFAGFSDMPPSPPGTGAHEHGTPRGAVQDHSRTTASMARTRVHGFGTWSNLTDDQLASFDPRSLTWQTEADWERMIDDPEWIERVAAQAESFEVGQDQTGPSTGDESRRVGFGMGDPVMLEALSGMSLHQHGDRLLTEAAEWIAHQRANHEVMLVNVLAELSRRGLSGRSGLREVDWLRAHDPSLTAGQAKAFVTVAKAFGEPRWDQLRVLVSTGRICVGKAAVIVDFAERARPVADPDDLETAVGDLTEQATALRSEELCRLARHHNEQIKPPRDMEGLDRARREVRGLWFGSPNATGMVFMRGVLDPESAAILTSAIDPLAVPCPTRNEHGRTIERDERRPERRRLEALLDVVGRGVAGADGVRTTDKAKVVVLIDHDKLIGDVRDRFGPGTTFGRSGAGTSLSGHVVSAAVTRRIACDAEIIPMVLGTKSEPLDVGRGRRLVTKGLRMALIARDKGCTWPGCSIPAQWCDAHHVVPWFRGGRTSLLNGALLCQRHHTFVHENDATAAVTVSSVTWHT